MRITIIPHTALSPPGDYGTLNPFFFKRERCSRISDKKTHLWAALNPLSLFLRRTKKRSPLFSFCRTSNSPRDNISLCLSHKRTGNISSRFGATFVIVSICIDSLEPQTEQALSSIKLVWRAPLYQAPDRVRAARLSASRIWRTFIFPTASGPPSGCDQPLFLDFCSLTSFTGRLDRTTFEFMTVFYYSHNRFLSLITSLIFYFITTSP